MDQKVSMQNEISNLKKDLMLLRIKKSSGENISVVEYKNKKKEVARLLTKINKKSS